MTIIAGQGLVLGDHAVRQRPIHEGFRKPVFPAVAQPGQAGPHVHGLVPVELMPEPSRSGGYRRQQDVINTVVGLFGFVDFERPDLRRGVILATQGAINIGGAAGLVLSPTR